MSLQDEIRDNLYGSDEDAVESELASSAYDEILESASYPHSAFKALAIAVAAEIGLIAMFLVAPGQVESVLYDENFLYVALAVFAVGFLIAFTTFRMFEHSWGTGQRPGSASPSILSAPTPRSYSNSMWIWFISSAAAVFNMIFFYLLLKVF